MNILYRVLKNHHKVMLWGSVVSVLIIIFVGATINTPVPFKSWDAAVINYILTKMTELSTGFIMSALFYYFVVFIPEVKKKETVSTRIKGLVERIMNNQARILNNLISQTDNRVSYLTLYLEELNTEDDFKHLLKNLDELILTDSNKAYKLLEHWIRYTGYIKQDLQKILVYYKEHLDITGLVHIEELIESLYFNTLPGSLDIITRSLDSKIENIADIFYEFDKKIRTLEKDIS
ncbi:hypothetical protein PghCCS26_46450 [Paenibacillus glycanilyticus]|uniref:Uncharacterized protein n=1 Tax=Paenibacillus glycanilyticus TaxID=126569 RepID=A0ABQ6NSK3_9BACL|nr:hypothetical protein [Paenibacillus glycanilyticus]GMK47515.1 hypothetical protein PghCCS26_46450 [Paenibacillus glycanilyticus]